MFAKKLQFNEDVKEYKDMRLQEHIGRKNQEQFDYQCQQINYVNNTASSKRRGFSAVLGGSGARNLRQSQTRISHGALSKDLEHLNFYTGADTSTGIGLKSKRNFFNHRSDQIKSMKNAHAKVGKAWQNQSIVGKSIKTLATSHRRATNNTKELVYNS